LLFLKGKKGKARLPCFESPLELLQEYLSYYITGLVSISPLIPEWEPYVLDNQPELIKEKMHSSLADPFRPLHNSYAKWLIQPSNMPDAEHLTHHWYPWAETLFGGMCRTWYPKKNKAEDLDT